MTGYQLPTKNIPFTVLCSNGKCGPAVLQARLSRQPAKPPRWPCRPTPSPATRRLPPSSPSDRHRQPANSIKNAHNGTPVWRPISVIMARICEYGPTNRIFVSKPARSHQSMPPCKPCATLKTDGPSHLACERYLLYLGLRGLQLLLSRGANGAPQALPNKLSSRWAVQPQCGAEEARPKSCVRRQARPPVHTQTLVLRCTHVSWRDLFTPNTGHFDQAGRGSREATHKFRTLWAVLRFLAMRSSPSS